MRLSFRTAREIDCLLDRAQRLLAAVNQRRNQQDNEPRCQETC